MNVLLNWTAFYQRIMFIVFHGIWTQLWPNLEQLDSDPWSPQSCPVALHPLQLQRIHSCHHLVKYVNCPKSIAQTHLKIHPPSPQECPGWRLWRRPHRRQLRSAGRRKVANMSQYSFMRLLSWSSFSVLKIMQISACFHSALSSWKELPYASQPYGPYGFYRNLLFVS